MFRHRRQDWHSDQPHTHLVHLYIIPYYGFPDYNIHGTCLLDEYQEIHPERKAQPIEIPVSLTPPAENYIAPV
jgi:hypothetical protein